MRALRGSMFGVVALSACTPTIDDEGTVPLSEPDAPGCLRVSPSLALPTVDLRDGLGASSSAQVVLENGCDGTLLVSEFELDDPTSSFELSDFTGGALGPFQTAGLTVTFRPHTHGELAGVLAIQSNDPEAPSSPVELSGRALAPSLQVLPTQVDLGAPPIGCAVRGQVRLVNRGNVDLTVLAVDAIEVTSDELAVSPVAYSGDRMLGAPPWVLPPFEGDTGGQVIDLFLDYRPVDVDEDFGWLDVRSTDPTAPQHRVRVSGIGTRVEQVHHEFDRVSAPQVDLVFSVDRSSGYMGDATDKLVAAFPELVNTLDDRGIDYQIAAAVTDDGCVLGPHRWIDSSFGASDAQVAFEAMIDRDFRLSSYGSNTERGFMLLEAALRPARVGSGGCNEGLLRTTAELATVSMSDEPEQSVYSYSHYVALFRSWKPDPGQLVMHALVGDYPGGCAYASAGTGYYEATVLTGGMLRSICADHEPHLRAIGAVAGKALPSYPLEKRPVADTLQVWVDGERLVTGWVYDPSANAIEFDPPLSYAAQVEAIFDVEQDCAE